MSKTKQTDIPQEETPKKNTMTLTPEEVRFIEEFRIRNKEVERIEQMKSLKQLQLEQKRKAELERQWRDDNRIVRGIFKYDEIKGGSLSFSFKKYPKDKVVTYTLIDGHSYDLPRMVAKHLNEGGKYIVHKHAMDKDGKPLMTVGSKIDRYSFYSTDFVDVSDKDEASLFPSKGIVTINHV